MRNVLLVDGGEAQLSHALRFAHHNQNLSRQYLELCASWDENAASVPISILEGGLNESDFPLSL
jgi:hypothetical protein